MDTIDNIIEGVLVTVFPYERPKKCWRWDDRIDQMEREGRATMNDSWALRSWNTCFVGEALADVGKVWESRLPPLLRVKLTMLGAGSPLTLYCHPVQLLNAGAWACLRNRLAEIRETVAEFYPPPKVPIPADKPVKIKRTKELVLA